MSVTTPLPLVPYRESGVTGFLSVNEYHMSKKTSLINFRICFYSTCLYSTFLLLLYPNCYLKVWSQRGINFLSSHILSKSSKNWFENRTVKGTKKRAKYLALFSFYKKVPKMFLINWSNRFLVRIRFWLYGNSDIWPYENESIKSSSHIMQLF